MTRISAVVPIYREEAVLRELCKRLGEALGRVSEEFEIVLVDDGGDDGSWNIIEQLSGDDPRIKGIKFSRNFGQHYAITAGLDACDGDWVVVMDGDLQDDPAAIPELYAKAREGYDVVFAARRNRPESLLYRLAQRCFYGTLRYLAKTDYDPAHGNFSIVSRRVVEHFRSLNENLRFYGGIVNWLGFEHASIPVQHGARFAGESSYTLGKRIRLAAHITLAHSDRPLRFSIGLGLVMSALSFAYGGYIIVRAMISDFSVEGWASLIASIYFTGGIILVVLGIVGIYIGKIFGEIKRRPLYVVAKQVGFSDARDRTGKNDL